MHRVVCFFTTRGFCTILNMLKRNVPMTLSLQKANFWKRISAYLFDVILTVMLTIGLAAALSAVFGYDKHSARLGEYYTQYEETYGIDFDITEEDYNNLTQEEKDKYTEAQEALSKDENVLQVYNTIFYLTLAIISLSLLISHLVLYFVIPLFFHNGQTLGKKVFGLAVMRSNHVRISNPVLFVRAILGLYTIETMVPVLLIVMIYFNLMGIVGVITIALLQLLQIFVVVKTETNSSIHDLLSDSVVVDFASQEIFETQEEMLAYKLRSEQEGTEAEASERNVAAEKAANDLIEQ